MNVYLSRQLRNVSDDHKFTEKDLERIAKYIDGDIFGSKDCVLWKGAVSKVGNDASYVNFWFHGRKVALHRLLYSNFVADLDDSVYLKFTCKNKGRCCNLNHIVSTVPMYSMTEKKTSFIIKFD